MKFRLALACAAALLAVLPQGAFAFGSEEHERIGNLAVVLATEYMSDKLPHLAVRTAALDTLRGKPGKYERYEAKDRDKLTYGDITTCVDFFLFPELLLAEIREERLKLSHCRGYTKLNFMQATHSNHAHFQHAALLTYEVLHEAALAAAQNAADMPPERKDEGAKELKRALILNAMADHYLQDFLAPGHVVTNRRALSDVVATAIHDRANDNPTNIAFKPAVKKLGPLAHYLCEEGLNPCRLRSDLQLLAAPKETGADIGEALVGLIERGESVVLRGDDLLWQRGLTGGPAHERRKQRLLLVLITARSIVDVLTGVNSFSPPQWREDDGEARLASTAFGAYEFGPPRIPGEAYGIAEMSRVIGVSIARESMLHGTRVEREVLTAEFVQGVSLGGPWIKGNFIPSYGLTYYLQGSANGWGPIARLSYVIPETEFSAGVYARLLSYEDAGGSTQRFSRGIRADVGFSSYLTLFVGIGRDFATSPGKDLEKGTVGFVGVELLFPTSQVRAFGRKIRDRFN